MKLQLLRLFLAVYSNSNKINYSIVERNENQFLLLVVYKNGNSLSLQGSEVLTLIKTFIRLQKTINTGIGGRDYGL